jgi:hypothetical protein
VLSVLIQTTLQELPSVGKATYLAARVHNHVKVENTPFTGVLDSISSLIKDTEELSRFFVYLRETRPDFVPQKKTSSLYLEDADQMSFEEYVKESVYSFHHYNLHGDRAYKQNNEEVFNTLVGDDGDSYSEQENIMDIQSNNPIERSKWRRKLPALLKRLHDKGKPYGISTLSCVRAMAIYKGLGKNVQDMKPAHFISYGIMKMDKTTGECTERLTQNSGMFQSTFQYWLLGKMPDLAYGDLIEFINICSKANIDLAGIDPKEYGESYIRTLITAYITPNKELVGRETDTKADRAVAAGIINAGDVRRSLNNISLSSYLSGKSRESAARQMGGGGNVSLATDIISLVKSSNLWFKPPIRDLQEFLFNITKQFDYLHGMFVDGVYCTKNAELKLISVQPVICDLQKGLGTQALLFSTGHFVLITKNRDGFLYIPHNFYRMYFEMKDDPSKSVRTFNIENERKNYAWGEWIPFGFS